MVCSALRYIIMVAMSSHMFIFLCHLGEYVLLSHFCIKLLWTTNIKHHWMPKMPFYRLIFFCAVLEWIVLFLFTDQMQMAMRHILCVVLLWECITVPPVIGVVMSAHTDVWQTSYFRFMVYLMIAVLFNCIMWRLCCWMAFLYVKGSSSYFYPSGF
jgi:hypothetical protein